MLHDRTGFLLILAVSCGIGTGCNSAPEKPVEKVVPVEGKVSIEGKPEAGVSVIFSPKGANVTSHGGTGQTDSAGAFRLKNYSSLDGVPAGEYIVTFSWMEKAGATGPDQAPIPGVTGKERIPPKWSDLKLAGRHNMVTIPEAGKKDLEFKVSSK
jgi:hypothetical protein